MHPISSDWLACLGMCPVHVMPSARVSFMPRSKLEKPLLKQELLFISDQHSEFSSSLILVESQPLDQLRFFHQPLNENYCMFTSNSRAMSMMCHNLQNSHVRHSLLETSNSSTGCLFFHGKDTLLPPLSGRKKRGGK